MKNKLLIAAAAAAALLCGTTASHAVIQDAVTGDFSLSYTPHAGMSATGMSFSSQPGDGAVTTGPGVGIDLGTQNMSGQTVGGSPLTTSNGNPFFLDGSSHNYFGYDGVATHSVAKTLPVLTVGVPVTVNFFTAAPSASCGTGCVTTMNAGGIVSSGSTNNITYGTITANFAFISPSGATGGTTITGTYAANYSGQLTCGGTLTQSNGLTQNDCIVWNTGDPATVNFTDGAVMTVNLTNAIDWNITAPITFTLTRGTNTQMAGVPEPASLAIFGTAVAGLGLLRRRRKAA